MQLDRKNPNFVICSDILTGILMANTFYRIYLTESDIQKTL